MADDGYEEEQCEQPEEGYFATDFAFVGDGKVSLSEEETMPLSSLTRTTRTTTLSSPTQAQRQLQWLQALRQLRAA